MFVMNVAKKMMRTNFIFAMLVITKYVIGIANKVGKYLPLKKKVGSVNIAKDFLKLGLVS